MVDARDLSSPRKSGRDQVEIDQELLSKPLIVAC